ncbi:MAG: ABC transporter ATP-binding protein, partial [Clostridiales bacterium]|nr:ABC transporter ATP-binding protein [Clostridiales bacterium]
MLELRNIVKDYEAGDTVVRALKGVDITFRKSEFVSILGPSGCGKTTLLNIVGGLDRYTCGDLIINGRSTRRFREYDWDAYRNNCVGFVFQNYNLIPHLSVLGNVELALTLSGESKSVRRKKAQAALEKVGLAEQIHKKPNQLSGGQMQRVAIARAIVNNPEIILADEPTGALDSKNSVQIADLLKEISKDRLIIMVTHNDSLAEEYSTRIIKFLDGEKVSDSDPYEPTQEERLKEIQAEREAHNEAFNPEEYAPEAYPDPTTPLIAKRSKSKNKKKGEQTDAESGVAADTEKEENGSEAEKTAPAADSVTPID